MTRRQPWLSPALLVLLSTAWCGAQNPATAPAQSPPPATGVAKLAVDTTEWNFGEVWQGENLKTEVVVRNTGEGPLEITNVTGSCGCTPVTRPKTPLVPGESSTFTISYDGKKMGVAAQTVTITSNDPATPNFTIKVSGNVKALYDITPKEGLVFGQLFQNSRKEKSIEIANRFNEKMELRLREGLDLGPIKLELKELEPGQRYQLTARTEPPLKVGHFQNNIELITNWSRLPEIRNVVYGFVDPPVAVRPGKLFLPRTSVIERKQVLTVSYSPDQPIEIKGVKASDEAFKVEWRKAPVSADGKGANDFSVVVTLPPGSRVAEGAEPKVEIETTSSDPQFQKLVVPIQVITSARPAMTPTTVPAGAAPSGAPTRAGGAVSPGAPPAPTGATPVPATQPAPTAAPPGAPK